MEIFSALVKFLYHKTLFIISQCRYVNSGNLHLFTCYSSFLYDDISSWSETEESGSKSIVKLFGHYLRGILDLSIGEPSGFGSV